MGSFEFDYFGTTITTDKLYRFTIDDDGKIIREERLIKNVYKKPCTPGNRISFVKGPSINDNALNTVVRGTGVYLPVDDANKAVDLIRNTCKLKIKYYEDKIDELKRILNLIK